jgi:hypothetical protein
MFKAVSINFLLFTLFLLYSLKMNTNPVEIEITESETGNMSEQQSYSDGRPIAKALTAPRGIIILCQTDKGSVTADTTSAKKFRYSPISSMSFSVFKTKAFHS